MVLILIAKDWQVGRLTPQTTHFCEHQISHLTNTGAKNAVNTPFIIKPTVP